MKKGLKLKLGMSVASLALLAGALSTTTYAWFTTNAEAKVSNVTVNAEATSDSIYLSLDGIHFSNSITLDASKVQLTSVSYVDGAYKKYNGKDSETATENWDATTAGTVTPDATGIKGTATDKGQYLTFTIYFKTTSNGSNIVFDDESTSFTNSTPNEFTLLADYDKTLAGSKYANGYLVNATRLAVTSYASGFEGAQITKDATFGDATRTVYKTVDAAATTYDKDSGIIQTDAKNYAWQYYQAVMGNRTNVVPTAETAEAISSTTVVATGAKSGSIYKADFTFYVEGWDADCMDAILGQNIDMALGFKLSK